MYNSVYPACHCRSVLTWWFGKLALRTLFLRCRWILLSLTEMLFGLYVYPVLHLLLLNDGGRFVSCTNVRYIIDNLSTSSPFSFVPLRPQDLLWLLKSPITIFALRFSKFVDFVNLNGLLLDGLYIWDVTERVREFYCEHFPVAGFCTACREHLLLLIYSHIALHRVRKAQF